MKLSKTSWLLIIVGAFIIALAGLGVVCFQQRQQQNQLNEQLALAQSRLKGDQLEQLPQRQRELQQHMSQTISRSEAAKTTLSQPIGSIAVSDILFNIAEDNSVQITEISSSGLASEQFKGVPCMALSLTIRVEGEVADLVSFITKLNGYLATGEVKSVGINIPEMTSEKKPSAVIQLVIYTYQGD